MNVVLIISRSTRENVIESSKHQLSVECHCNFLIMITIHMYTSENCALKEEITAFQFPVLLDISLINTTISRSKLYVHVFTLNPLEIT